MSGCTSIECAVLSYDGVGTYLKRRGLAIKLKILRYGTDCCALKNLATAAYPTAVVYDGVAVYMHIITDHRITMYYSEWLNGHIITDLGIAMYER
jgi:hypothetical protein